MGVVGKLVRLAIILGVLGIYGLVVWLGLTEESRRSMTIVKNSATTDDYVAVSMKVTSIDTVQGCCMSESG